MTALLIINAIVIGSFGGMFAVWGSNAQSRLMGLVCVLTALANVGVLTGVIVL